MAFGDGASCDSREKSPRCSVHRIEGSTSTLPCKSKAATVDSHPERYPNSPAWLSANSKTSVDLDAWGGLDVPIFPTSLRGVTEGRHRGDGIGSRSQSDVPDDKGGCGLRDSILQGTFHNLLLADMKFECLRAGISSHVHRLPVNHGTDTPDSSPEGHQLIVSQHRIDGIIGDHFNLWSLASIIQLQGIAPWERAHS